MKAMSAKRKRNGKQTAISVGTCLLLLIYLSPVYLVFCIALKSKEEFAKNHFGFPREIVWSNITDAIKAMEYGSSFLNSFLVTFGSIVLTLLLAAMASYALGRRRNPFFSKMYIFFLAGMMIPFQLSRLGCR